MINPFMLCTLSLRYLHPVLSVIVMRVLFHDALIVMIGIWSNGTPLNVNWSVDVTGTFKVFLQKEREKYSGQISGNLLCHACRLLKTSTIVDMETYHRYSFRVPYLWTYKQTCIQTITFFSTYWHQSSKHCVINYEFSMQWSVGFGRQSEIVLKIEYFMYLT